MNTPFTPQPGRFGGGPTPGFGFGPTARHDLREHRRECDERAGRYLEAVGGWNPQLLVNQDFELDYRMRASGRRLLLDPNIRIRWKSSQNLRDLSHQYARYGTGKAAVVGMHPRSVKPRHLLLPILVVVMPVGLLFSVLTRRPWMATILLPYAAFLGAGSADEKLHGGQMRRAAIAPVVLLTMHFSWGFGFWRGVARALMGSNKTAPDPFRDRDLTQGV